jgi:hypothetical protein
VTSNIEAIFEPGERVVSMLLLAGTVYVATDRRVYRMRRDPLTDADAFQAVEFHRTAGQKPSSG